MNNKILRITVLFIALLTAGCQSSKSIPEATALITETSLQTEIPPNPPYLKQNQRSHRSTITKLFSGWST